MKISLIDTGYFYADGGAMFGAIPKAAWKRRYTANNENLCILAMRSMLIQTDCGKNILIDNGVGSKQISELSFYRFFNTIDLCLELEKQGLYPENITDVVFTHLHFDHCGYTTHERSDKDGNRKLFPIFKNATHWVSNKQWTNFLSPNALEKDSYFPENMLAIKETGLLQLIDTDQSICKAVNLRLYNGHTPGQIVIYAENDFQTVVFTGDVIPLAAHISPEWISAYDIYPLESYTEKVRLLEEAADKNQLLVYCHDAYTPFSEVKKTKSYFSKKQPFKEPDISFNIRL